MNDIIHNYLPWVDKILTTRTIHSFMDTFSYSFSHQILEQGVQSPQGWTSYGSAGASPGEVMAGGVGEVITARVILSM